MESFHTFTTQQKAPGRRLTQPTQRYLVTISRQGRGFEETEVNYPVRIPRYELIADSDGAGRQRGGLGLRRDYTFPGHSVTFTILADRDRAGPPGLFGGQSGQPAIYLLNSDGHSRPLPSKTTIELEPGEVIPCSSWATTSPSIRAALQESLPAASTTRRYGPVQSLPGREKALTLPWSMTIRVAVIFDLVNPSLSGGRFQHEGGDFRPSEAERRLCSDGRHFR
jgi:Hydantoinase B/oxoprolinase